jgi:hypothetical protein
MLFSVNPPWRYRRDDHHRLFLIRRQAVRLPPDVSQQQVERAVGLGSSVAMEVSAKSLINSGDLTDGF